MPKVPRPLDPSTLTGYNRDKPTMLPLNALFEGNDIYVNTSHGWISLQGPPGPPGPGGIPGGPAGGDLSGDYPDPNVEKASGGSFVIQRDSWPYLWIVGGSDSAPSGTGITLRTRGLDSADKSWDIYVDPGSGYLVFYDGEAATDRVQVRADGIWEYDGTAWKKSGQSVPQTYAITSGYTKDRAMNPQAMTLGEVATVLATLIDDMIAAGLIKP